MLGFDSTTDDVLDGVDLSGRRVLVTGTAGGLGLETARALAAHGAEVIGAVRDVERGKAAAEGVGAAVEVREVDLSSLASIRAFADQLVADGPSLDVIITNAGVMGCPKAATADGFEMQIGTNHIGHFSLVNRVLPLLRDGGRIVSVSSAGHRFSDVNVDDPNFEQTDYDPWISYGRAKTANVLFAVELDRRLRDRGVRATAIHPGGIATDLGRHLTDESIAALQAARGERGPMRWKTVPQGAATQVWAGLVADGDAVGGRYCEDCAVSPVIDDPNDEPGVMRYAVDADTARALWDASERWVET
jgi:NAD(P)-dependent dehydrogenase (short-subunit alcohol dehydrogenase family)